MKKDTMLTIMSIAGSLMSVAATLLNDKVSEQKLNDKIDKKVQEALKTLAESKTEE